LRVYRKNNRHVLRFRLQHLQQGAELRGIIHIGGAVQGNYQESFMDSSRCPPSPSSTIF
jgi:hypothetical protein